MSGSRCSGRWRRAANNGQSRRKSDRSHTRSIWQLGIAFHHDRPGGNANTALDGLELALSFSSHARTIHVLLCSHAFHYVVRPGSGDAAGRHSRGPDREAVHCSGFHRRRVTDRACCHIIYSHSTPHGQALADLAQRRVRHRDTRRVALLVAGQKGCHRAANLCSNSVRPFGRTNHSPLAS